MSPSSRKSRRRALREPEDVALPATDPDRIDPSADGAVEKLRSFILEVSAGRAQGVGEATATPVATLPVSRRPKSNHAISNASPALDSAPPQVDEGSTPLPATVPTKFMAASAEPTSNRRPADSPAPIVAAPAAARRRQPREPRLSRRRAMPAWTASLGVHVALITLLTTASLAAIERPEELEMLFNPIAEEIDFAEVPIEPTSELSETPVNEVSGELLDPGQAPFGDMSSESALGNAVEGIGATGVVGSPGSGPLNELGALFGEGGHGMTTFGDGLGGAPTAKFFGAQIEGRRIVFVLDNSGSMQGGRLETVIAELLRCVDLLADDQEFYVIFHSDTIYPLFYPDPVDRYLRPTAANKRRLAAWLDSVELCLGDAVEEAIAAAAMIEPDTVFLLSDGRIQGDRKLRYLLAGQSRDFPIHTFAVGMGSSVAGRRNLEEIATANHGKFSESEIPPEMRDLSRREMRPYHQETPGPVWGREVRPFGRKF